MKKFVIVMISLLVLFVFLMLNYLLWDKENLLRQRDTDKIEQDWLRGQNLTLQSTIEELERSNQTLKTQNDSQQSRIVELEQQVSQALQKENETLKEIQSTDEALRNYKSFMGDKLNEVAAQYFSEISAQKLEESWTFLEKDCKLWGNNYSLESYIEFIAAIQSIMIVEENKESEKKPFTLLEDQGGAYEIKAQIQVTASIREENEEGFENLKNGDNTLEVIFTYDPDTTHWAITSLSTIEVGKP